MLLNWGIREYSWESLGPQGDPNQSILKEISPGCSLEGLMLKLKLQYLATWCEELTHWKRPWSWERLKAGEGDDRGWYGWMASPTQWTWVWVSSGSWWWTGRPGVLQSIGLQRVGHDWATGLNWTEGPPKSDQLRWRSPFHRMTGSILSSVNTCDTHTELWHVVEVLSPPQSMHRKPLWLTPAPWTWQWVTLTKQILNEEVGYTYQSPSNV